MLVVIVLLVFGGTALFAGGEKEAREGSPSDAGKIEGAGLGYKFYIITHGSQGDSVFAVMKRGVDDAAKLYGCDVQMLLSEGDTAKQVDMVEQAISANPDGIGTTITDPEAFDEVIQKAIDKGIPVISFNNDDSETPNARLAYVGADLRQDGYDLGKSMQQYFSAGDHVVIPEEVPGAFYAVARASGIKKAMEEIGVTTEELDAGYELATCTARISAYMQGHPDTDGIICVGGLTTDASAVVIDDMNLSGKVVIGGSDLLPNTIEGLKRGDVKATLDQQLYLQTYYTVVQLAMANFGQFTPVNMNTSKGIITPDNVNDVLELVKAQIR